MMESGGWRRFEARAASQVDLHDSVDIHLSIKMHVRNRVYSKEIEVAAFHVIKRNLHLLRYWGASIVQN
jgi:hypothetical protein